MLRESVFVEFKVRDSFVCSAYQEIFCYQEGLLGLFVKLKMIGVAFFRSIQITCFGSLF